MQLFDEIDSSPTRFIDLMRDRPDELAEKLDELGVSARFPLLRSSIISMAIVDDAGRRLHSSGDFGASGSAKLDAECVRFARSEPGRVTLGRDLDAQGRVINFVAYASARIAVKWLLPSMQKQILTDHQSSIVAISAGVTSARADLFAASYSYGLTDLQARVVVAVVLSGSVKTAAQDVGVSYATAREAVASALKVTGASRLPALVEMITVLAAGVFPRESSSKDFVLEATGLSPRQLALASCLSSGLTRTASAKAVNVSLAVAKKEIDQVHSLLGTRSGAAMARRLNEIKALAMLTDVSLGEIALDDDVLVPTSFIARQDGTRIAYSDYGPRSGKPVLVLHSSMTTRPVASTLVRALQAGNYRVLSVDRPGFGLSEVPGDIPLSAQSMFATSAQDVSLLCRRLGLKQINIVARGAAQIAATIHGSYPSLLGRVVLVNPDPPSEGAGLNRAPIGVLKEIFFRRPALIGVLARMMGSRLSPRTVQQAMLRSLAGCEADMAAAINPRHFADYYRSVRPFATGRVDGFVFEQTALVSHAALQPLPNTRQWTILLGQQDTLNPAEAVGRYWQSVLPGARIEMVSDAGRLLAMTHPEQVLSALRYEPG